MGGEGWPSFLRLQPQLYKPADGLWAIRVPVLFLSPLVDLLEALAKDVLDDVILHFLLHLFDHLLRARGVGSALLFR